MSTLQKIYDLEQLEVKLCKKKDSISMMDNEKAWNKAHENWYKTRMKLFALYQEVENIYNAYNESFNAVNAEKKV